MPYAPSRITGPIILTSNASSTDLPGVTQTSFLPGASIYASAYSQELYARTPGAQNNSGITADYASHLYLNNYFDPNFLNLISGFVPSYYIDVFKNVKTTYTGVTGGFTFAGGAGSSRDRYEAIRINYTTGVALADLSGNTLSVITGIDLKHDVYPGNTHISGQQIFYRKLGRLPA
jgi:hypothetical protein